MFIVRRYKHNPILAPDHNEAWESFETFNAAPIKVGSKLHLLYRAQSLPENIGGSHFSLSTIGRCEAKRDMGDKGVTFVKRAPFILPDSPFDRYGCEDPRVTYIGGKYYTFYTALSGYPFNPENIKAAVAVSKNLTKVAEKHLVTPFNAKAMTLFPEKINGKLTAILTVHPDRTPSDIAIAQFQKEEDMWSEKFWNEWYENLPLHTLNIPRGDNEQVEVGSGPIKTKEGWLLVYAHIGNYSSNDKRFGIRAILLDHTDLRRILGQLDSPFLVPEESYEKYGTVPNTIFPSGAVIRGKNLDIFYSGTDTVCAVASVPLAPLLDAILKRPSRGLVRSRRTPLLKPQEALPWEAKAVFNPAAVELGGKIHILYRAMSNDNTSVVGYASSKDGVTIDERLDMPVYGPRADFESKKVHDGNSGCEDPRISLIGDTLCMCYTAYDSVRPPAVAVTTISVKDFLAKKFDLWTMPVIASADGVDDKDACLLPAKISGKYFLFHRTNGQIVGEWIDDLAFKNRNAYKNIPILTARPGMWDGIKVGISAPPIRTKEGWLLIYHGVSDTGYRVGAALLDLKDPTKVIARLTDPILEPEMDYEKSGQVGNVVFPCGAVVRNGILLVYYGGADSVVNVATMKLSALMEALTLGMS